MTPYQYEALVAEHFKRQGFAVQQTPQSNDYGIDLFAERGGEKLGIQVKMYGNGRRINRAMIMELHGAKDYFDCDRAVIVTDGTLLDDALVVANKLAIEVVYLPVDESFLAPKAQDRRFDRIWKEYVMPLAGKQVTSLRSVNTILEVNWGGLTRRSTNGNKGHIKIEVFRQAINRIFERGFITRAEIDAIYKGRASSAVFAVLAAVPLFEVDENAAELTLRIRG